MKFFLLLFLAPLCVFGECKILILGDSNSYGVPERKCSWVSILKEEFKGHPDIVFLNYAVGMSTSIQCYMQCIIASEIHDPDIVIYAGGLVDVLINENLNYTKKNIEDTVKYCVENKRIVLFGLISFNSWIENHGFDPEKINFANNIYFNIANTHQVIPFTFLDDYLLSNKGLHLGDFIHPNYEGQKIIAKRVKKALGYAFPLLGITY